MNWLQHGGGLLSLGTCLILTPSWYCWISWVFCRLGNKHLENVGVEDAQPGQRAVGLLLQLQRSCGRKSCGCGTGKFPFWFSTECMILGLLHNFQVSVSSHVKWIIICFLYVLKLGWTGGISCESSRNSEEICHRHYGVTRQLLIEMRKLASRFASSLGTVQPAQLTVVQLTAQTFWGHSLDPQHCFPPLSCLLSLDSDPFSFLWFLSSNNVTLQPQITLSELCAWFCCC